MKRVMNSKWCRSLPAYTWLSLTLSKFLLSKKLQGLVSETSGDGLAEIVPEDRNLIAITLALNTHTHTSSSNSIETNCDRGQKAISDMDQRIHRILLGAKFYKQDRYDGRLKGCFLAEKPMTNLHYHGIVDLLDYDLDRVSQLMTEAWKATCPSGSIDIQPILNSEELDGWVQYMVKEQPADRILNAYMLASMPPFICQRPTFP